MLRPAHTAILFPGQGAAIAGARAGVQTRCPDLYRTALELLDGADPFEHAARSTRYAQPAVFLASLASWRSVAETGITPACLAGHSLGELSALTAAGVWSEEQGLRLVVRRGELMADAARDHGGGMLAVLGGEIPAVRGLAGEHGLSLANDNGIGQVVLSGACGALAGAARSARRIGLRAIPLDVTGAFHSPAMASAVEPFASALEAVEQRPPSAPVYSALTAAPFRDVAAELSASICAPVRWRETMRALASSGIGRYLDVGPDEILQRLVARELPGHEALHASELGVAA
jgi:malonyl CoA-acyl carrier protein transacylase